MGRRSGGPPFERGPGQSPLGGQQEVANFRAKEGRTCLLPGGFGHARDRR